MTDTKCCCNSRKSRAKVAVISIVSFGCLTSALYAIRNTDVGSDFTGKLLDKSLVFKRSLKINLK